MSTLILDTMKLEFGRELKSIQIWYSAYLMLKIVQASGQMQSTYIVKALRPIKNKLRDSE